MKPSQVSKTPRRVWLYGRGGWTHGPIVVRSGDEWGRSTLLLRLPGQRAIVWAWRWCRKWDCCEKDRCPHDGRLHTGWSNGQLVCEPCNPGSTACPDCGVLNYTCDCFDRDVVTP